MIKIKNKVIRQEENIEEQDLLYLEKKYGFKFPEAIKQFYLQYNGGRLEKNCYPKQDDIDDVFILSYIYPVKYGSATLDTKMELNYVDEWWPKEYIPFGYDGGGNSFCFHKETGAIYYLYEDDPDDDDNIPVEYVAPDFLTFINNMVKHE